MANLSIDLLKVSFKLYIPVHYIWLAATCTQWLWKINVPCIFAPKSKKVFHGNVEINSVAKLKRIKEQSLKLGFYH